MSALAIMRQMRIARLQIILLRGQLKGSCESLAMLQLVYGQFDCCFKCVVRLHAYIWYDTTAFPISFGDWVDWFRKGNGNREVIVDLVQVNLVCTATCSFTYYRCALQHLEVIAKLLSSGKGHGRSQYKDWLAGESVPWDWRSCPGPRCRSGSGIVHIVEVGWALEEV